ncbi:Spore germination protein A1 [compost metagenome]
MELTYEILREAGVRIPKNVGQAVSIVGTLVIGQAAVSAGFISSAMVIIVSITAISSFVIPETGMAIAARIIRFAFIVLAGFIGLYGILFGVFIIVMHLASLRSFGMPYMSPIGPYQSEDFKDSLFRFSWPRLKTRPANSKIQNPNRQDTTK